MKVQFSFVGFYKQRTGLIADMEQIPREGETVNIPGLNQGESIVRTVVWYPVIESVSGDTGIDDPFVYIVLGPSRP
jgi:hypothetical protein